MRSSLPGSAGLATTVRLCAHELLDVPGAESALAARVGALPAGERRIARPLPVVAPARRLTDTTRASISSRRRATASSW
jgi:hypothetical protein